MCFDSARISTNFDIKYTFARSIPLPPIPAFFHDNKYSQHFLLFFFFCKFNKRRKNLQVFFFFFGMCVLVFITSLFYAICDQSQTSSRRQSRKKHPNLCHLGLCLLIHIAHRAVQLSIQLNWKLSGKSNNCGIDIHFFFHRHFVSACHSLRIFNRTMFV